MRRVLFENLTDKLRESLRAVVPIALIVLTVFFFTPMSKSLLGMFLLGTLLVIGGMSLFTLGADMAMIHVGELIGAELLKSRKTVRIAVICCILGIAVTVAEPDLSVLAGQVSTIDTVLLIACVAAGVGILLAVAVLRILFKWKLNRLLILLYFPVLLLAVAVSKFAPDYLSVAFDSGGVTTGPITVPFILSLGIGLSSVRGGKSSQDDSFGLVALGSVGPILSVLVLGLIQGRGKVSEFTPGTVRVAESTGEIGILFVKHFPDYLKEVFIALLPILITFILFQIFTLKLPKKELRRVVIGLIYTYLGLCCFLTGVNVGFMPAGSYLGAAIASTGAKWALIPLGMLMAYFIVSAEPAVQVLNRQVETITGGTIRRQQMMLAMSVGIACAIGLSMLRVLTGISIWYVILPGYALAIGLSFFVKDFLPPSRLTRAASRPAR